MSKAPKELKRYVFRIHYEGAAPLDTSGSKKRGGRWNRKNKYGCLYTCLDKEALKAELYKMCKKRGLEVKDLFLWAITTIEVEIKNYIDLTSPDIRKEFEIKLSDILSDKEEEQEICRPVADEARALGCEAIISPSAAEPKGKNLNIYPDKFSRNSHVRIIKTEPLINI